MLQKRNSPESSVYDAFVEASRHCHVTERGLTVIEHIPDDASIAQVAVACRMANFTLHNGCDLINMSPGMSSETASPSVGLIILEDDKLFGAFIQKPLAFKSMHREWCLRQDQSTGQLVTIRNTLLAALTYIPCFATDGNEGVWHQAERDVRNDPR